MRPSSICCSHDSAHKNNSFRIESKSFAFTINNVQVGYISRINIFARYNLMTFIKTNAISLLKLS